MTREEAWKLVNEYVKSPRLLNHLLAVEACMRYFAELYGEDPETWGVIGLLHDFDYERYPNSPDHPLQGERILAELGVPEDIRHTICSHADAVADRYRAGRCGTRCSTRWTSSRASWWPRPWCGRQSPSMTWTCGRSARR